MRLGRIQIYRCDHQRDLIVMMISSEHVSYPASLKRTIIHEITVTLYEITFQKSPIIIENTGVTYLERALQ